MNIDKISAQGGCELQERCVVTHLRSEHLVSVEYGIVWDVGELFVDCGSKALVASGARGRTMQETACISWD